MFPTMLQWQILPEGGHCAYTNKLKTLNKIFLIFELSLPMSKVNLNFKSCKLQVSNSQSAQAERTVAVWKSTLASNVSKKTTEILVII